MSPRPPSPVIVVDANIVLSVALGLRARPAFEAVLARRPLLTSARAREEILGRAAGLGADVPEAPEIASAVLGIVTVVDETLYADRLDRAAQVLRLAAASRNGSTNDAHVLALAWTLDADIWSHDRDFAGTGWPSWSSANLRASLGGEPSLAAG